MSEPELPSWTDIAAASKDCQWLPGPPKWSNSAAKALYDELNRQAQEIAFEYRCRMTAELEPLNKQMADLYSKFATPTMYPYPKISGPAT